MSFFEKNEDLSLGQISKNPKCSEQNDFDKYNVPIDPLTFDPIPENEIYVLNQRCYNVETIRKLLSEGGKDPFSQKQIPKTVYDELIPPLENKLNLQFLEEFTKFCKKMFDDRNFKDNKEKYLNWLLHPPIFNDNKSIEVCSQTIDEILFVMINYHMSSSSLFKNSVILAIGAAIVTMGFFVGENLAGFVKILGESTLIGVGGLTAMEKINQNNEMVRVNQLFEDYINCVNNVYI
jgi:hypothetical protein